VNASGEPVAGSDDRYPNMNQRQPGMRSMLPPPPPPIFRPIPVIPVRPHQDVYGPVGPRVFTQ
jgi:hypothetical protein